MGKQSPVDVEQNGAGLVVRAVETKSGAHF